ncbi:ADP-sugar pyrophosphatase isoform X2 [Aplysia californica]|nr:ADP-sugar pyrophosphatase isoform X2 [Aplysia californica]
MASKNSAPTKGKSEHISTKEVARGKWVVLNNVTYKDPTGKERSWEAIGRTTKCKGEADAVGVIAAFNDPSRKCRCVILVRQYRPPLKAYTIEFPAGLIDAGETAAQAAVREMKEETGYSVSVSKVLPASALDGGVGETTMKIVICDLDVEAEGNKNPAAVGGGADEFVDVLIQPLPSLLEKLNEYSEAGDVVDSRVYAWAVGRQSD